MGVTTSVWPTPWRLSDTIMMHPRLLAVRSDVWIAVLPVPVGHAGHMLTRQLKGCLLPPDRVKSAVRSHGISSMSKVYAVVLEPPGTFSVITRGEMTI